MSRSAFGALAMVIALAAACTTAPQGASPATQPTDPPSVSPTAPPSPTATASSTADATPRPTPCDEYYGDICDGGTSSASPPPAQAASTLTAITYGEIGAYLAGPTRMALYTFDNDSPGSSSCSGNCADSWPPLTIPMGETPVAPSSISGELGTIERTDGTYQVTYNAAPLYYFVGDTQLYDVTGDGLNGVWHLARP